MIDITPKDPDAYRILRNHLDDDEKVTLLNGKSLTKRDLELLERQLNNLEIK